VEFWRLGLAGKPNPLQPTARPARALAGVYIVCMARLNVYLPDELAEVIRPLDWNLSNLLQRAVRERLDRDGLATWLSELEASSRGAAVHAQTLAALEPPELERSNG
jgi:post-segregation antitoxin (ccd killing protein)